MDISNKFGDPVIFIIIISDDTNSQIDISSCSISINQDNYKK